MRLIKPLVRPQVWLEQHGSFQASDALFTGEAFAGRFQLLTEFGTDDWVPFELRQAQKVCVPLHAVHMISVHVPPQHGTTLTNSIPLRIRTSWQPAHLPCCDFTAADTHTIT